MKKLEAARKKLARGNKEKRENKKAAVPGRGGGGQAQNAVLTNAVLAAAKAPAGQGRQWKAVDTAVVARGVRGKAAAVGGKTNKAGAGAAAAAAAVATVAATAAPAPVVRAAAQSVTAAAEAAPVARAAAQAPAAAAAAAATTKGQKKQVPAAKKEDGFDAVGWILWVVFTVSSTVAGMIPYSRQVGCREHYAGPPAAHAACSPALALALAGLIASLSHAKQLPSLPLVTACRRGTPAAHITRCTRHTGAGDEGAHGPGHRGGKTTAPFFLHGEGSGRRFVRVVVHACVRACGRADGRAGGRAGVVMMTATATATRGVPVVPLRCHCDACLVVELTVVGSPPISVLILAPFPLPQGWSPSAGPTPTKAP
jgi:hypothetical protein